MLSAQATYQQFQHGSRDDLVLQHAALVKRTALHLKGRLPPSQDLDDLIQAGMIGLLEAASHFSADKGASFETYAAIRIRGAMMDQLRRGGWAPRSVAKSVRDISSARQKVEQRVGRSATAAEVARELAIDLQTYHQWLNDGEALYISSLDQLLEVSAESGLMADQPHAGPLQELMHEGFESSLADEITRLPEREQMVMALYYEQSLNMKEIGLVMGVSESRVCQLHSQAVSRLRKTLNEWASEAT